MIKLLSKLKIKHKNVQNPDTFNPHEYWMILIRIFFVLLIGIIIFSLYLLFDIRNKKEFHPQVILNSNQILIKEDLLKNIKELFDNKVQKEEKIISNPTPYVDPSL